MRQVVEKVTRKVRLLACAWCGCDEELEIVVKETEENGWVVVCNRCWTRSAMAEDAYHAVVNWNNIMKAINRGKS